MNSEYDRLATHHSRPVTVPKERCTHTGHTARMYLCILHSLDLDVWSLYSTTVCNPILPYTSYRGTRSSDDQLDLQWSAPTTHSITDGLLV